MYGCMYVHCTFIHEYMYALIEMIMVGGNCPGGNMSYSKLGGNCPGESVRRNSVRGKVSRGKLSVPRACVHACTCMYVGLCVIVRVCVRAREHVCIVRVIDVGLVLDNNNISSHRFFDV